jgi:methanogenic corrinoid protein MtbC1
MYTIGQASIRAGVSVALLRQWERRYGVVQPDRTASGYRVYDEDAIARFRAMRTLVDEGWSPSAAATEIIGRDARGIALPGSVDRPVSPAGAAVPTAPQDLPDAFLAASVAFDTVRLERVLDEMFAQGTFEHVAETQLLPALRGLGEAWAAGSIDVAVEHAASHAILRRLAAAYEAAGHPTGGGRRVLVGLPPGARHELGALIFAVTARRAGLDVLYLGADLPVRDWLEAVRKADASAVVIGAVAGGDIESANDVRDAIEADRPDVLIAFGGGAATAMEGSSGVVVLPPALTEAVDAIRMALADGVP